MEIVIREESASSVARTNVVTVTDNNDPRTRSERPNRFSWQLRPISRLARSEQDCFVSEL
jgi:hypothetical protein